MPEGRPGGGRASRHPVATARRVSDGRDPDGRPGFGSFHRGRCPSLRATSRRRHRRSSDTKSPTIGSETTAGGGPEKENPRGGRASRRPLPKARRISGGRGPDSSPDSVRSPGAGAAASADPDAGAAAVRATRNRRPSAAKTTAGGGPEKENPRGGRASRRPLPKARRISGGRGPDSSPDSVRSPGAGAAASADPDAGAAAVRATRNRGPSAAKPQCAAAPEKKNPRGGRASRRPVPKARRISAGHGPDGSPNSVRSPGAGAAASADPDAGAAAVRATRNRGPSAAKPQCAAAPEKKKPGGGPAGVVRRRRVAPPGSGRPAAQRSPGLRPASPFGGSGSFSPARSRSPRRP